MFTFIDLFSGIGGFRIALEKCGGKCLGYSEIDRAAIQTYRNNFDTSNEIEFGDITQTIDIPKCDVLVGGVPCQPWSVAGKMKGFDDDRGKLWKNVFKLTKQASPKAFIYENVKGLVDPRNRHCFNYIIKQFESLGYEISHKLLNAYDFGLPQNRERVFIVGTRKDLIKSNFNFPVPSVKDHRLFNFIDDIATTTKNLEIKKFDSKILFGKKIPISRNRFQKIDELNDFFIFCDTRNGHTTIHSWDIIDTTEREKLICMTLLRNRRKSIYGRRDGNPLSLNDFKKLISDIKKKELDKLANKRIFRITTDDKYDFVNSKNSSGINGIYRIFLPESNIFSTLTATGTKDFIATQTIKKQHPLEYKLSFIENIYRKKEFRKITSREAARLQGFPDDFKLHENYQIAMRQFGNAVPVNVVQDIMKTIKNIVVLSRHKPFVHKTPSEVNVSL